MLITQAWGTCWVVLAAFAGGRAVSAGDLPHQYVVVNLHLDEVSEAVFGRIGALRPQGACAPIGLGAAAIFSYLQQPQESLRAYLLEFLRLAEEHDLPVVVQLDGEQWWGARPDLWNWWDPGQPGYDPDNRYNVEWTGWGPEHAIRIGWRNWGRQIRVLPPPNLMSPRYRAACEEEMRWLVPLVLDWWRGLPEGKRHLLIGIKVGWESSIGVNTFYYPNGNELAERPAEDDPTYGLTPEQVPGRGVIPIGYAAVKTAGLAESGELREEHLAEVARRHMEDLCRLAAELGAPRDRLFTHGAGWKEEELLYDAAVNRFSCPGWSFYRHARNPAADAGVRRALGRSDAPFWAAVEWLPVGASTPEEWRQALLNTLRDPRCRYLCIYNWRGIKGNEVALEAIRAVLAHPAPE